MGASRTAQGAAAARPMRADARRNYDLLLASAAAAFTERGADDVSLEEIARRAGVGIGTLYRHFPTRQDLLEAVYRDQVELMAAHADKLMAEEAPGQALAQWLSAMVAFGATKRTMSATLLATLGKDSELISSCGTLLREATTALVVRGQEAGVIRSDVQPADIQRLAHGLIMANNHAPGDAGQTDRLLTVIVAGLLTEPAGE